MALALLCDGVQRKPTHTAAGPPGSKQSEDRTSPRLQWRTKTRAFCGRCSTAVIDFDQTTHIAQFRVPALRRRLGERGPQNCACPRLSSGDKFLPRLRRYIVR